MLTSRSVPTLLALSGLAIGLFLFQGALEAVRGQVLVRVASRFDRRIAPAVHDALMRLPLLGGPRADALQPVRDVDTIRGFMVSQGPVAMFDMPWIPIYVAFIYLLHPVLGFMTIGGALGIMVMTLLAERRSSVQDRAVAKLAGQRYALAAACERNAEVLCAMGFGQRAARQVP